MTLMGKEQELLALLAAAEKWLMTSRLPGHEVAAINTATAIRDAREIIARRSSSDEQAEVVAWRGKYRADEKWKYFDHPFDGFDPDKYQLEPLFASPSEVIRALTAALAVGDEGMGEANPKRCHTCHAPRTGDTCHKCGGPLEEVAVGWTEPRLPPIDKIRRLAESVGYGLGVHGSLERDLDLIAAPWVDEAVSAQELAQHIATALGGAVLAPEDRPLGRWSCNIQMDGWYKLIDLSVAPRLRLALRDKGAE